MWPLGEAELSALGLSAAVALRSVLINLLPAVLAAWLLTRRNFPGRTVFDAFVHLPLVLPPVLVGYLLLLLLGTRGPIGGWLDRSFDLQLTFSTMGAAVATAVMSFPLMVRAIRLSVDAVDPRLEQAGATLGASRAWVFATVTLPLITPGIVVGAILAFAKAMGEFGATITFVSNIPGETQTVPSAIYGFLQVPGGDSAAMRLVLVSVAVAMLALLLSEIVATRVARRVRGA
jgi:molybdate transport system permease protein